MQAGITERFMSHKSIGSISNYYGGLSIKQEGDKYFWGIMDWNDDYEWEEIPKYLFDALSQFDTETKATKWISCL